MNRLTKDILQKRSNLKHNNEYEIIGEYINNCTKTKIKHLFCGTIFDITPNGHVVGRGGCTKCYRNFRKTKSQLQEESNKVHNGEYNIVGDYINCDTKIFIKHIVCGNTFSQTPDKHIHNNKCPICFGKNRLTREILQEKSDKKYNKEYTILGEYINNQTPILIRHNICGTEYLQSPNNHLRERICYSCRGLQSLGEKIIENYLKSKNIKFHFNKSLLDCRYGGKKLRFDFYLPDYNTCIEYDGEQHFRSVDRFGGEENYIIRKKRDETKNEWCIKNGVRLIRISYKERIIDKLDKIFNI